MAFSAGEIEAIFKMRDQLTKELKRVVVELRQAGKTAKDVGRQFETVGTKVQSAGSAMLPFSAALAAGAIAAFKFGNDFDVSMTKIITLVGIGATEVDGMRKTVLDLAGATAKAPQELADALFVVTSAGARGAEALEILEAAAKASAVGLGATEDIARAVTSALTAYGSENLSASQATNVLFKTVREGNLNAGELASSLGRVIGVAAEMGVSFADVGAVVATYTRLGVSAEEATTGLRSVLTGLLAPTTEAAKVLESVGLSAEGLRKQIKDEGLPATLVGLSKAFKGNTEALAGVIPNVRALSTVLGVAGSQSESFLQIAKSIASENDALAEGFATVADTVDFKFNKALTDLQTTAISTFEAFKGQFAFIIEGFTTIVGALQRAVDVLEVLSPTAKNVVAGLVALGAVAAPALIVLGSAIRVVGFAMQGLGVATAAGGLSFAGLTAVLIPLATVVAIAAAAFALFKFLEWIGLVDFLSDSIESLAASMAGVTDAELAATREARAFAEGLGSTATVAERLATQLGGAGLISDMSMLEGLMINLAQAGLLDAAAMKTLADRAKDLQAGGQELTTGLARVVAEMDRQAFSADKAGAALVREKQASADAAKAAGELEKSQTAINAAFTELGFTTIPEVTKELRLLEAVERKAIAAGTSERDVAALLSDAYTELADRAKASGLGIDALTAAVDRNRGTIQQTIEVIDVAAVGAGVFGVAMQGSAGNVEGLSESVLDARQKAADMADAYKLLGVTTTSSLTEARIAAQEAFTLIKESGTATRQEVEVAMMALADAVKAETGRAATFGSQAFRTMATAIEGSFAQMTAGTKSFADAFSDIWNSLKAGFLGGLTEMLGGFLGKFIPGMNQGFSSLS
ncbi:MAG TPA: phage tail tape measure protein, partial [Aurantimonas coralicida]|nr:phage tail tape measure protein [Aurantimonas coralicida]